MNKTINHKEHYESPNLNVFNIKLTQCIAQSNPVQDANDGGPLS